MQSNEYRPDPDVKVSHNEWYAVPWEVDFGKQITEHETPEIANNIQKVVIQEVTNTNDEPTTPQVTTNQTEVANDVALSFPVFSILTTNVGNTPYIHRPHSLKVHLLPQNHRLQLSDIIREKQQSTIYDLILIIMLILTSDDLTL